MNANNFPGDVSIPVECNVKKRHFEGTAVTVSKLNFYLKL